MELHHLRYVVAIADHGSFTAAAAALHVSQPALSYAITRLERELGTRLFDRIPTGARLTTAGSAFVAPARRAIAEAESGRAAVDAVRGLVGGDLRVVGIRTAVAETAAFVAAFHAQHPAVRLLIEDPAGDGDVIEAVRSGRCDVGVMRSHAVPEDLQGAVTGTQTSVIVLPSSLAPSKGHVSEKDLADIPLILPLAGTRTRALSDARLRAAGVVPIIACECSHIETAIGLVRGGVGALITSESAAATLGSDGLSIRALRPTTEVELAVVTRPSASPAATAFCQLVTGKDRRTRR